MDREFAQRILAYRTTMAMVRGMFLDGIITEEEYAEIDTIMTKKYGLSSCTIYR